VGTVATSTHGVNKEPSQNPFEPSQEGRGASKSREEARGGAKKKGGTTIGSVRVNLKKTQKAASTTNDGGGQQETHESVKTGKQLTVKGDSSQELKGQCE